MDAIAGRKIAEGEKALLDAAKLLKKSWFSKPDPEAAAAEYEKAATCFRVAKAVPRAIDAFSKASEMHDKFDSSYMAAKHLETAAFLAGSGGLNDALQSAELYEKASVIHQVGGRLENAAEGLGKAARGLEGVDDARAGTLATSACELYDDPDVIADASEMRVLASLEAYKLAVPLLLRAKRFAAAGALLRKQATVHAHPKCAQPHNVARCELAAVVAFLHADDFASAADGMEAACARGDGFAGSEEAEAAEELLGAFTSQSEDAVVACVGRGLFGFLDNQIALVAKRLTLQTCGVPHARLATSYSSNYAAAGSAASGSASGGGGGEPVAPTSVHLSQGTGDFGEVAPEDEAAGDEDEEVDLT